MPAAANARHASGRERARRVGFVEAALEREDVALEPGQQVQPGAEAGVRELRQVGVEVDHAGQEDPRAAGRCAARGRVGGRSAAAPAKAIRPARVDDEQPIGLVARAAAPRAASAAARGSRTGGVSGRSIGEG